jgi:hypothetical protein
MMMPVIHADTSIPSQAENATFLDGSCARAPRSFHDDAPRHNSEHANVDHACKTGTITFALPSNPKYPRPNADRSFGSREISPNRTP